MIIQIDVNSTIPIYTQLTNAFTEHIARGNLQPGDELPSIRSLAADIGINMHTVNKSYSILRQKGLLTMRKGRCVVADIHPAGKSEEQVSVIEQALRPIIAEGICYHLTNQQLQEIVEKIYKDMKGD